MPRWRYGPALTLPSNWLPNSNTLCSHCRGPIPVAGTQLVGGSLLYLGPGCREVELDADSATSALVIGGVPFDEDAGDGWNFVARGHDEIVAARSSWEAARTTTAPDARFGGVAGVTAETGTIPRVSGRQGTLPAARR